MDNSMFGCGGDETVLVVDDEPAVRELASLIVGRLGYRVFLAASGREALEISRRYRRRIDLLFTDVVMPAMDGVELAERMVAERPGLKVLFFSGYATRELLGRISAWPGGTYLSKPCDLSEIGGALRSLLDGPRRPASRRRLPSGEARHLSA